MKKNILLTTFLLSILIISLTFISAELTQDEYNNLLESAETQVTGFSYLKEDAKTNFISQFNKLKIEDQKKVVFDVFNNNPSIPKVNQEAFINALIQSHEGKSFEEFNKLVTYAAKQELENAGATLTQDFEISLEKQGLKFVDGVFSYEVGEGDNTIKRTLKLDDLPVSKTSGLPELKQITYNSQNGFYYNFGEKNKVRKDIVCDQGRIDKNGFVRDFSQFHNDKIEFEYDKLEIKIKFNENPTKNQIIQIGRARETGNDVDKWVNGIHIWGKDTQVEINGKLFKVHDSDPSFENQGYGFVEVVDLDIFHMRGIIEAKNLQVEIPSTNSGILILGDKEIPRIKTITGLQEKLEYLKIRDSESDSSNLKVTGNMKYAAVYSDSKNIGLSGTNENVFVKSSPDETFFELIEAEVFASRQVDTQTQDSTITYQGSEDDITGLSGSSDSDTIYEYSTGTPEQVLDDWLGEVDKQSEDTTLLADNIISQPEELPLPDSSDSQDSSSDSIDEYIDDVPQESENPVEQDYQTITDSIEEFDDKLDSNANSPVEETASESNNLIIGNQNYELGKTNSFSGGASSLESIAQSVGNTPTLIKFGATWCGPCRSMASTVKNFASQNNVLVIDVDIDNYPNLHIGGGIPSYATIKNGKITKYSGKGAVSQSTLESFFR